jgi:hypothetical protein
MAMSARDIPVTRQQVFDWLEEYEGQVRSTQKMRDYLQGKLDELNVGDVMVDTTSHDGLPDEVPLVEMILMDIGSYG